MRFSSYKSTNLSRDFFRTIFDSESSDNIDNIDYSRDYYQCQEHARDPEPESKLQRNKNDNVRAKEAESAKYSAGQIVYVKKYNPRRGKFQICAGEIVSSVDRGFGAISYTFLDINTRNSYRAWEDEIYSSYSAARESLDADEAQNKVEKKDPQSKITYDNSQDIKSINDNMLSVVSVSPETGTIKLKSSSDIDSDLCCIVDDNMHTINSDIIATNSICSDIEQRVNYLEKELTKEKKKRSKLVKLGIACLFGG